MSTTYVRAENNELAKAESATIKTTQQVLRDAYHRIGADGVQDFNVLNYLQGIAANTSWPGTEPCRSNLVSNSTTAAQLLVRCEPRERIIINDIFLSVNGASNISFIDAAGTSIFPTMRCPNAGQGFVFNSQRGMPLAAESSLYVKSSAAFQYDCMVSYSKIEYTP